MEKKAPNLLKNLKKIRLIKQRPYLLALKCIVFIALMLSSKTINAQFLGVNNATQQIIILNDHTKEHFKNNLTTKKQSLYHGSERIDKLLEWKLSY